MKYPGSFHLVIRFALLLWLACGSVSRASLPTDFYVSPEGSPSGDGSDAHPWDLKTALAHPAIVAPGSNIWLRGGKYKGPFTSKLTGTQAAPITVAAAPDERATLEGCYCPDAVLWVDGAWTIYRDFEVTTLNPNRFSDQVRGPGIWVMGPHTVFANLVVHDNNQGFSFWTPAVEAELYGNLIFDNGWDEPDRGHGHAIYTQNHTGVKRITDNIIFDQFGDGLHAYGTEEADLDNFYVEGNIFFDNGSLSVTTGYSRNILLGGGKLALDSNILNNVTYYPITQALGDNNIGYRAGTKNVAVTNNYFVGGNLAIIAPEALKLSANFLYLNVPVVVKQQYPDNQYAAQRPAKNAVFVRKNKYERGRIHIAIYNWERATEAAIDISNQGLDPGSCYELRNVEDYYGPFLHGLYGGGSIPVPLTGWGKRQVAGWATPRPALPEFGAFVVSLADCGGKSSERSPANRIPPTLRRK